MLAQCIARTARLACMPFPTYDEADRVFDLQRPDWSTVGAEKRSLLLVDASIHDFGYQCTRTKRRAQQYAGDESKPSELWQSWFSRFGLRLLHADRDSSALS